MNTTKQVANAMIARFRGSTDRQLEGINLQASQEISAYNVPNPRYDPAKPAGPANPLNISGWDALHYWGPTMAGEMTNRLNLNKNADAEYRRLICDARLITHDSRAGNAAFVHLVPWYDPAVVYIRYNMTTPRGEINYFFNLMIMNVRTLRTEQIAHISFHSNTRGGAGSNIGNFHLKDETVFPPPAYANIPFRRYTIGFVKERGALKRFEFILQKQSAQSMSQVAITFSKLAFQVLQEFFDAGFSGAAMNTPFEDCSVQDPVTGAWGIPVAEIVAAPAPLPRIAGGKRKTRRVRKNRS